MRALLCLALSTILALTLTRATAEPRPSGPTITLLTGDTVDVSGAIVTPAPGREGIPITKYRENGHLFVIPADAGRLIATDRLDRRLFDVTELVSLGYHDDATIPVIRDGHAATARKGAPLPTTGMLWLDGKRRVALDQTVPQIGAPTAWQTGLTGDGVTVGVVDTGVDQTHPDLAGREIAERNFSGSADNLDHAGHGTHVASTIASNDVRYRGVAPGARLLDVKVFDDDGWAQDSAIIAGMRWAADQGAKIVNLSLGSTDRPGADPVEAAVEELSARGVLVVVAAGNDYRPESVSSPGSADAALTVGAVDKSDAMADFSSRGPRLGDGAVKPDLVAPGVNVTAAQAGGGHVAMDGTSMATPHVSGAAALLAQQHPDWTGQQLKAALIAAAAPIAGTEYDRGAGRVDVARAITQQVTATPANVTMGVQAWPHTADVEKPLTYQNDGDEDVTLRLSATGGIGLDTDQVTVPAGNTATVRVRMPGSTADGPQSGLVTATAGDTRVVTPVSVLHEPKSHTLTIDLVGPDGAPTADYFFKIASLDRQWADFAYDPSGHVALRLPEGHYLIDTSITDGEDTFLLSAPDLPLTSDVTLELDARTTRPVTITPPVRADLQLFDYGVASYRPGTRPFYFSTLYGHGRFATAHAGPTPPRGVATIWVNTQWLAGPEFYGLAYFWDARVPTGFVKQATNVATVRVHLAEAGARSAIPQPRGGFPQVFGAAVTSYDRVPSEQGDRVEHYNPEAEWATELATDTLTLRSPSRTYQAGRTYHERFGDPVFGPVLPPTTYPMPGITRSGDYLGVDVPLLGDRAGNAARAANEELHLYRNGVEIEPEYGWYPLPPEEATYRLTASTTREAQVSTSVTATWTFSSAHTTGDTRVPVDVLRFTPRLTGNTAPHGRFAVPVTMRRAAGTHTNPRHLTVDVSYDEGHTWQRAITHGNQILLTHPATATSVSLRARAEDRDTTVEQTIIRAYLLQ
jgi:hypothetical protein